MGFLLVDRRGCGALRVSLDLKDMFYSTNHSKWMSGIKLEIIFFTFPTTLSVWTKVPELHHFPLPSPPPPPPPPPPDPPCSRPCPCPPPPSSPHSLSVDDVLHFILVRISLRSLAQQLPPVSVNHVLVYQPVCTMSPWIGFGNNLEQSTVPQFLCLLMCPEAGGRVSPLSPGFVFCNHLSIILDIPSPSLPYSSFTTQQKKVKKNHLDLSLSWQIILLPSDSQQK